MLRISRIYKILTKIFRKNRHWISWIWGSHPWENVGLTGEVRVKLSTFTDKNHHRFEQHKYGMRSCVRVSVCEWDDNLISIFGGQFGSAYFVVCYRLCSHILFQLAAISFSFCFDFCFSVHTQTRTIFFFFVLFFSHFCFISDSKLTLTYSNCDSHFFLFYSNTFLAFSIQLWRFYVDIVPNIFSSFYRFYLLLFHNPNRWISSNNRAAKKNENNFFLFFFSSFFSVCERNGLNRMYNTTAAQWK